MKRSYRIDDEPLVQSRSNPQLKWPHSYKSSLSEAMCITCGLPESTFRAGQDPFSIHRAWALYKIYAADKEFSLTPIQRVTSLNGEIMRQLEARSTVNPNLYWPHTYVDDAATRSCAVCSIPNKAFILGEDSKSKHREWTLAKIDEVDRTESESYPWQASKPKPKTTPTLELPSDWRTTYEPEVVENLLNAEKQGDICLIVKDAKNVE